VQSPLVVLLLPEQPRAQYRGVIQSDRQCGGVVAKSLYLGLHHHQHHRGGELRVLRVARLPHRRRV